MVHLLASCDICRWGWRRWDLDHMKYAIISYNAVQLQHVIIGTTTSHGQVGVVADQQDR